MALYLVPEDAAINVIPLEKVVVLVGRQADCDATISTSRKVSRKHCCFAQVNHEFMVRDLGSTNGVFVNEQRVKRDMRIKAGDTVVIGDVVYRVEVGAKKGRAPTAPKAKPSAGAPVDRRQPAGVDQPPDDDVFPLRMPAGAGAMLPVAIVDNGSLGSAEVLPEVVIEPSVPMKKVSPRRPRDAGSGAIEALPRLR